MQVLKQKLVYEGAPLRLESKNAYMARKIAERKSKVDAPLLPLLQGSARSTAHSAPNGLSLQSVTCVCLGAGRGGSIKQ